MGLENCKVEPTKAQAEFGFEVTTPSRTIFVCASNQDEVDLWTKALLKAGGQEVAESPVPFRKSTVEPTVTPEQFPEDEVKLQEENSSSNKSEMNPMNDVVHSKRNSGSIDEELENKVEPPRKSTNMSGSEYRYFKKFGLTPPPTQAPLSPAAYESVNSTDLPERDLETDSFITKKPSPKSKKTACCCIV